MSKKNNKQSKEQPKQEAPVEAAEVSQDAAQAVPEAEPNPVEVLEKQLAELNERYLRLMAEYENYRKRSVKEKSEIYPQAIASAIEKFLPVLDNLERADAYERTNEEFAQGFDMIYQSFGQVLQNLGVEAVGQVGETFNPELHDAVMHIEDPELGQSVIAQVLQKGYKTADRVIRHAMVQVAN